MSRLVTPRACNCEYPCSCMEFEGHHVRGYEGAIELLMEQRARLVLALDRAINGDHMKDCRCSQCTHDRALLMIHKKVEEHVVRG